MAEFFVWSVSNPAPLVGDEAHTYVEAETALEALSRFQSGYKHPAGLYAVRVYSSADGLFKKLTPLVSWKAPSDLVQRIEAFRFEAEHPKGGTATVEGLVALMRAALNLLRDASGELQRLQS